MFGIGPMELAVVAAVALMLFSPKELPKMLRSAVRFWGKLRATADEFKDTILHADGVDELTEMVQQGRDQIKGVENDARRELMKARADMRKAQQKLMKTNKAKAEIRKKELDEEEEAKGPDSEDGAHADNAPGADADEGGDHGAFKPEYTAEQAAERKRLIAEADAKRKQISQELKEKREAAGRDAAAARGSSDDPDKPAVPPPPTTSKPNQGAA